MTTDNTDSMDVLDYEPKANPETGRELLPNPERGCGYLEESKGYIRTDPVRHPDGEIPAFVVFDPPIPYKEGTLRSYQNFDGLAFQRSLDNKFSTIPEDDLTDLWDRLEHSESGQEHWGEITTAYAEDMLMWVGETYYDDPLDFIQEARKYGLSKAIPVSKRQEPPAINPMKTRVFLVHPTAYRVYEHEQVADDADPDADDPDTELVRTRVSYRDDDNRLGEDDADDPVKTISGVIGYSYLTRVVWTAPSDDDIPKWAEQYQDTGQLDIVDVGEPVPEDEAEQRIADMDDGENFNDPEIRRKMDEALSEVGKTLTPGHGADVDAADDEGGEDDQQDTDDTEADSDRSDAADDDADTVVPSDKDGRDVEATDDGDRVSIDDLTYNQLKAVASRVDADVSAQPSGDELKSAVKDAAEPSELVDTILKVADGDE